MAIIISLTISLVIGVLWTNAIIHTDPKEWDTDDEG